LKYQQKNIHCWGTVITIFAASPHINEATFAKSFQKVEEYLLLVEQIFSRYLVDSEINRFINGELPLNATSPLFKEVWKKCHFLKSLTQGLFDPWSLPSGYDPSGFVKGWAAENALKIISSYGIKHIQINAAGDLAVTGGYLPHTPWSIGITHPHLTKEIAKVIKITSGSIATSGTYESGLHIYNPTTKTPAKGIISATVYGPDGGTADALATYLVVNGVKGVELFKQPYLKNYHGLLIPEGSNKIHSF